VLLRVAGTLTDEYGDTLVEDGDGRLFTPYRRATLAANRGDWAG
jgi:hypothetical protein